jgi:hypothetical protein
MRYHWRLATLLTTILAAPPGSAHAQHEEHAMSTPVASTRDDGAMRTLSPSVASDVARLRAATARFKSLDSAVAAGYERTVTKCIAYPKVGGMGFHHENAALLDGKLEVERPEILVYRRSPNGSYDLSGVEYEVPYAFAPRDSAPPTIMGQPLKHFDAIKMWYLHVWPWFDNPAGMFADWNSRVTCE